ncbi:MAG: nucleotidyltransferase domain-containing protein [Nitrospiraceae bacterium]|nr:nucleotidyltransferase domain-containing protein [Nitrospiraceae bacterium]MDA8432387.1 nucleotidyltransferase domain-containing protein [Nitrospiraceae bacterium]
MMTEKDRAIALELKEKLSQVVPLVDFKVYGSRARGSATEDSDMDVFIEVASLDSETKKKIRQIAWEVGFEHLMHISPLIFTRHEIEKSPLRASDIVKNIEKEGVAV